MVNGSAAVTPKPADELRSMLDACERTLGQLRGSGAAAESILHGLDSIAVLLPKAAAGGADLRSEQARLGTVQGQLRAKAPVLLRELREGGGLAAVREAVRPDPSHWWWYLDERVRACRYRRLRRGLVSLAAVAALLVVAVLVYQHFWAPDPQTVLLTQLQFDGERFAHEGDFAAALAKLEEAQRLQPNDGLLYLWRGVLLEALGQREEAEELFDTARPLFESSVAFHLARGQTYLQLQHLEEALSDANAGLQLDPDSPEGHFLVGMVYEAKGGSRTR